jgi:hypothetical protein
VIFHKFYFSSLQQEYNEADGHHQGGLFMSRRMMMILVGGFVGVLAVLVVVGNVAVAHTNPPVTYTIQWDSPETQALAQRACFDCHSHETKWPWYAFVAPMSFLVVNDVNEAREQMNFSTGTELEAEEMRDEIEEGGMPLPNYLMLHPEAKLTDAEKEQLLAGLAKTFGGGEDHEAGG